MLGAIREGRIELTAIACLKQMAADTDQCAEVDARESKDLARILPPPLENSRPGEESRSAEPALVSSARPLVPSNDSAPLRVQLVEGDFTARVMLQSLSRKYGECHIAVNSREAVEAFRAAHLSGQDYQLVCMDVRLRNGCNRSRSPDPRLRGSGRNLFKFGVRIFMTTAIGDLKTIHASYRALCDAYLIKPIDGAQLEHNCWPSNLSARRRCPCTEPITAL